MDKKIFYSLALSLAAFTFALAPLSAQMDEAKPVMDEAAPVMDEAAPVMDEAAPIVPVEVQDQKIGSDEMDIKACPAVDEKMDVEPGM